MRSVAAVDMAIQETYEEVVQPTRHPNHPDSDIPTGFVARLGQGLDARPVVLSTVAAYSMICWATASRCL